MSVALHRVRRYLFAIAVTVAVLALRAALEPVLGREAPLLAVLVAPVVAALYGGFGPGIVATLLGGLAGEALFITPIGWPVPPDAAEWTRLAIFGSAGALLSWLIDTRRTALAQLTTEREALVRAQALLSVRERSARAALEAAPAAMLLIDRGGSIRLANQRAERLFGYSTEELLGSRVDQLVPEALRSRHVTQRRQYEQAPVERVMGAGRPLHAQRKDGSLFPVEVGLNPVQDDESLVLASVTDVSERKLRERELAETNRQLASLTEELEARVDQRTRELTAADARMKLAFTAARIGTWTYSLTTRRFRYTDQIGPMFGRMPGFTHASVDAWVDDIHPEERQSVRAQFEAAARDFGEFHAEYRACGADGQIRWISTRGRTHGDATDGEIIGVAIDVSERKRLEEDLRAVDRQKERFFAILGHELRNPLSPLMHALHKLRQGDAGAGRERLLDIAERQTRQLARLVEDLRDVARASAGKIALTKRAVSVEDFVRDAIESSRPAIEQRDQRIDLTIPKDAGSVAVDPVRIEQVLENLLRNASKYTPNGGRIAVVVEATHTGIAINVEDDGMGIAPEMLPRLFEPFAQEERTSKHSDGGLGLGLTIAKQLVELHGGSISARSNGAGQGSVFQVSLPRGESGPTSGAEAAPRGLSPALQSAALPSVETRPDDFRDAPAVKETANGPPLS